VPWDWSARQFPARAIVEVIARAGELVRAHTLRAYDAIHLATALREEASELAQREPAEESP
jgi:predicted nucleic acid-binding protein